MWGRWCTSARKTGVAMTVSGSLVTGPGTGSALLPDRKLSGCDHLVIHDGDTFTVPFDRRQEEMLARRKRATQEGEYSDAEQSGHAASEHKI